MSSQEEEMKVLIRLVNEYTQRVIKAIEEDVGSGSKIKEKLEAYLCGINRFNYDEIEEEGMSFNIFRFMTTYVEGMSDLLYGWNIEHMHFEIKMALLSLYAVLEECNDQTEAMC